MDIQGIIEKSFQRTQFEPLGFGEAPLPFALPQVRYDRLEVEGALLEYLSQEAFRSIAFYTRSSHLRLLAQRLEDPELSENDRLVIQALLRNALIAAQGKLPLCQDTGTATILGWKDESVRTGADDGTLLSRGAERAYRENRLRSSQTAPLSLFEEYDTKNNLPAQIHIESVPDGPSGSRYRFLFVAKGGGSSNKTSLFQMSKALLETAPFEAFLMEKIEALGTAACPPYRLAVVVGGTSPEENLGILKLATTELLDSAPAFSPGESEEEARRLGWIRRDPRGEKRMMDLAVQSGLGAQFGGSALALDARLIRLPRHGGSCPVSIGLSCSAHRNLLVEINKNGVFLEKLERNPVQFLKELGGTAKEVAEDWEASQTGRGKRRQIEFPRKTATLQLDAPMENILIQLSQFPVGSRISLSGPLLVARDAAHLRWHRLIAQGKALPDYLRQHPIYYAGPSETPEGKVIGSFGPTTAQRMDGYAEELMSRGIALVTLAKGNRSPRWAEACKKYGGFYLGTIGGAAALIAEENILSSEILEYPDLGMEAVRKIWVQDLLAFVITDNQGRDLYAPIDRPLQRSRHR